MSWVTAVPHAMVARKPGHGMPCNGCGVCCMGSKCQVGRVMFGNTPGPCPALVKSDDKYVCGVLQEVASQPELAADIALLIRAGEGCDARINGEPVNTAFHRQQDRTDRLNRKAIKRALRNLKSLTPP